jgi:hypothetical protein
MRLAVLAVTALLLSCSDTAGPPAPAALAVVSDNVITAPVGTQHAVSVAVTDRRGAAIGDVAVTWSVTAGGGSVSASTTRTDATGTAVVTWMLGTTAGTQTLTAQVQRLPTMVVSASATPGSPTHLVASSQGVASAPAGTSVSPAPAVVVRDRFGNPVPGEAVTFAIAAGGGSVGGAAQVTNAEGVATVGSWTLGTAVGANTLTATVAQLEPVTFAVAGVAGAPALVEAHSEVEQTAVIDENVPITPAVRVTDAHGNPVAGVSVLFRIETGGGGLGGAAQVTGDDGIAQVGGWIAGVVGPNTLSATVAGLSPVTFTAWAEDPSEPFNLWIDAVHLNQGNQTAHGSIGGVIGRPGLVRVVVRANLPNGYAPPVLVRFYQHGSLIGEELVPAPRTGVPVTPDLGDIAQTWNLALDASSVVAGLSVEAVVDPDFTVPVSTRSDNHYPQGSGAISLDVRSLAPLRITFIPIHATLHGRTGSITGDNLEIFLEATRRWIPGNVILPTVRTPYTTGLDLSVAGDWSTLLSEIQAVRTAEGAVDEYYHGIIGDFPGIRYGGLAYRPFSPTSAYRSALSYDRQPYAAATIAHELGHNFGRMHTPCGDPANIDPNYPHADATLGSAGYDILTGTIANGWDLRDYMSYCRPRWTSDYTYQGILQWRRDDSLAQSAAAEPIAASGPDGAGTRSGSTSGVLVWGRTSAAGVTLSPAFALEAPPALPSTPGSTELRGTAADGAELFRFSFDGAAVEDGGDADEHHFAWFVPLAQQQIDALDRIELVGPSGSTVRRAAPAPAADAARAAAPPRVERAAGRLRVRWEADSFPMALVRDSRTGRVLSFARNGEVMLPPGLAPERIEIILSDGVRSLKPDRGAR